MERCGNCLWLIDQVGWFENNIEGKIRDERMVELWHNKIVGVEALPRKYPRIYTIFKQKKCVIGEMGTWREKAWCWEKWR